MRKFHRAVHFDFHNMPGIQDLGRDFDAAAFAQRLADAHVDYINFFTQCNRGYAYYPTKVGIPYPGLQRDIFGEVLRECHARGIGVTAYINIGLMHEQQRRNPHWNHVDKEGRIHRDPEGNPNYVLPSGKTQWEEHPEWFGMPEDGIRKKETAVSRNFCVSQDSALEYISQWVIRKLQKEWYEADFLEVWIRPLKMGPWNAGYT